MRFIAYYRVSTVKQGVSGLGLEAQRSAVSGFLTGAGHELIAEFTEIESGRKSNRRQLQAALKACKLRNATLIIAKLDRLARNVAFTANLMESSVDFVAVDNPHANKLTIHLLAAVAEHEREMISQRTKAALLAAKARGVKLGNPNLQLCRTNTVPARAAKIAKANERAGDLKEVIESLQEQGKASLRSLASGLNELGIPAPLGGDWHPQGVKRLLLRLA